MRREGRAQSFAVAVQVVGRVLVDHVLTRLVALDAGGGKGWLVEVRYCAGTSSPEVAAALGTSPATVGRRDWASVRLSLRREVAR